MEWALSDIPAPILAQLRAQEQSLSACYAAISSPTPGPSAGPTSATPQGPASAPTPTFAPKPTSQASNRKLFAGGAGATPTPTTAAGPTPASTPQTDPWQLCWEAYGERGSVADHTGAAAASRRWALSTPRQADKALDVPARRVPYAALASGPGGHGRRAGVWHRADRVRRGRPLLRRQPPGPHHERRGAGAGAHPLRTGADGCRSVWAWHSRGSAAERRVGAG